MTYRTRRSVAHLATVCIPVIAALAAPPLAEGGQDQIDVAARARGADHVVTATVARVVPMAVVNEFGDQLIISRATLTVEEVHKGAPAETLTLDVEGGTLDGVTLRVSDLPELRPGDRAVFFVTQSRTGQNIPHRRGDGILKLDDNDMVAGTTLSLSSVRAQIAQP